MQQRANAPDPFQPLEKRRVALALQGGGSHGAFTWGVLDRLLAEPSLEIVGISGTSAGAMNAGVLADGLRRGGASQARLALHNIGRMSGTLPGYGTFWPLVPQRTWHLDHNPLYLWADMLTRVWSPYQINCSNYHPSGRCCSASTSKGCAMMRAHRASLYAPRTYAPDCVACSTMPNYRLTCCSPRRACRRCIKRSRSATTSIGMAATPETRRSPPSISEQTPRI